MTVVLRIAPARRARFSRQTIVLLNVAASLSVLAAAPTAQACDATDPQVICSDATIIRRSYEDATRSTLKRTNDDLPWISQTSPSDSGSPQLAPFALTPTDSGVNAKASLNQLRDYNAKMTAKKIEDAKKFAPKAAPNAAPPTLANAPVDVWTSIDAQGLQGSGDQTVRTGLGADYRVSPKTTVGVAAERGETQGAAASADQKVSATVKYAPASLLSIDAKSQWEATSAPGSSSEKSSVSIAPRVGKAYKLEEGRTIEPFVAYKQEFGYSGAAALSNTQSAGVGVTYQKPDAYSLSVTTDFDNVGAKDAQSLNSKLQLKLPIN